MSARTNQELVTRAAQFGLILDDISITHLTFGRYQYNLFRIGVECLIFREFTAAVEQKQVAQQEAEKARFLVERAEFYKKAAVIQV